MKKTILTLSHGFVAPTVLLSIVFAGASNFLDVDLAL